MSKEQGTSPAIIFIFLALVGFVFGALPCFVFYIKVKTYERIFPRINSKDSKVLIQCEDGLPFFRGRIVFPLCWQPGVCTSGYKDCPLVMSFFLEDEEVVSLESVPDWCPQVIGVQKDECQRNK